MSGDGYSYSGYVGTWTGDAESVSLTTSAQVRCTELVVTYSGRTLNSVVTSGTPTKTSYYDGQAFDPAGLTITAKWSDGDVVLDAGEIAKITWSELKVGDTSVTGTYEEVDFVVNGINVIKDTLNSIAVTGTLTKSAYIVGDSWSAAGLVATGTYTGKGEVDITNKVEWSFDPASATSESITSVTFTASYDGKSGSKAYDVTVTVYTGYVRVNSSAELQYGDEVLIGAHDAAIMMGAEATNKRNAEATINMSDDHTKIDSEGLESKIAKFTVTYGTAENTFAFADSDGYLQMNQGGNELYTKSTLNAGSDYVLVVETGVMHVRSNTYLIDSEQAEIKYNSASSGMFRMYKKSNGMSSVDLYKKSGSADLEAARTFTSEKMKMSQYVGDNTYDKDRCDANYAAAKTAYNALSIAAKNLFNNGSEFEDARTRLSAWAAANGETFNSADGTFTPLTKLVVDKYISGATASYAIIIIVATVSITALGVTLMVLKKKKHN